MIKELVLHTTDLQATTAFYREILQLPVAQHIPHAISITVGHTQLIVEQASGPKPCYHFAIDIPHNQLDEARQWMQSRTELLEVAPGQPYAHFDAWNARSFYFFDNGGNLLELISRYDLPNAQPTPFTPQSLLRISEIGIATPDVGSLYASLQQQGIPLFAKQPPLPNFAAIGEEDGLFILAQAGRSWYPTSLPAQPAYTKVLWQATDGSTQSFVFE